MSYFSENNSCVSKIYCNHPLDTEFPSLVTKKAATSSHSPVSGMMQGSVNTSLEISSRSRIKDKYLLSLDNCFRIYGRFVLVHIDYKVVQFIYTNFSTGAAHGVLIFGRH
jgi:hypothetical protein